MNLFSFIKSRTSILDVISHYSTLKRAGLYFKGICPFHHEKTPSFTVSPDKEIFYCFGCHEGGDVITFISKVENCSALDGVRFLAERYGIDIPAEYLQQTHEQSEESRKEKEHYWHICKVVAQWAHDNIKKNNDIISYIKQRNITALSVKNFMIGYFPSGLSAIKSLIEYAKKEHLLIQDLLDSHCIAQGKTVLYSPFEDRLIFPIKDSMGRFCGFGGRIVKPHDERAKYYNSKENPYFTKGSLVYNLDGAKKSMQTHDTVFLVEGYTDCIAMVQAGYTNTVATLGTACTFEHLKQLSRYISQIYVIFDGDNAGQKAVIRLAHLCWQTNIEFKIIKLPSGYDPASYLAEHATLEPLIAKAIDIFDGIIETQGKEFGNKNLAQKVQVTREILELIAHLDDPLKKDILLKKAATAFDMPFATLSQEMNRQKVSTPPNTETAIVNIQEKTKEKSLLNEITTLEKKLFCAIIVNGNMGKEDVTFIYEYFSQPLQNLLKKGKELQVQHGKIDVIQFLSTLPEEQKSMVSQLLLQYPDTREVQSFDELLVQFQKKHWKSYVHDVKQRIAQAKNENKHNEVTTILLHFQELKKKLTDKGLI